MPKLKTQSRQLAFASSFLQSRGDRNIFISEPSSGTTARAKGSLYVVTETDGDSIADRAFCRLVAEHIRTEYYRDLTRGPTDALRAALRTAASKIKNDDRNPEDSLRPVVGLTCVAACDGTIAIAQAVPVQVFVYHDRDLVALPDPPVWEDEAFHLSPDQYVGFTDRLRCTMRELHLAPQELVLVASSALAQCLPRPWLAQTMARTDLGVASQQIRSRYVDATLVPAYGLLIQFVNDPREDVAAEAPLLPRSGELLSGVLNRLKPSGGPQTRTPPTTEPRPRPATSNGKATTRRTLEGREGQGDQRRVPPRSPEATTVSPVPSIGQRPVAQPRRSVGPQVRRDLPFLTKPEVPEAGARGRLAIGIVAVVLALILVAGGVKLVQRYQQVQRQQAVGRIVASVRQQEDAAAKATDASAQLTLLRQAEQVADTNQRNIPGSDFSALHAEVQSKIDQLLRASTLSNLQMIGDLSGEGSLSLSRIVVDSDTIYALDQGKHRVMVMAVAGGKPAYPLSLGTKVGLETVGNIKAIALAPGGLYALDDGNVVWLYQKDKKSITRLKVPGSENWQDVRAIASQSEKLLVLDAKQNRIFQYSIQADKVGPSTDYLAPTSSAGTVDLSHSSDMAADATSVFVLQADGTILKFASGVRADFPESGLAVKMTSPSSLYASGRDAAVYVADPSSRRIVKFAKDGRFLEQLNLPDSQAKPIDAIQAISVDESQNKAVFATGSALMSADVGGP